MSALTLYLLGPFHALLDDAPLAIATDKARVLLAYLAVGMDRPHRRDELAGLLWPDQPQDKARHSLRQALSSLRREIGREREAPFFLATRETIQFNPASDHFLDVAAFKALVQACQGHRHRRIEACRPCIRRLEETVALYRGDLLAGFFLSDSAPFEDWVLLEREWLHREAIEALALLARYYERRGDYDRARHYAWRQVELEPWCEEAHRQLMRLLAVVGDRSAALAQYQRCCQALEEQLGVEPTSETARLYGQIRDGVDLRILPPRYNLPPTPTSFVGRKDDLSQLADLSAHQGKIALAREYAEESLFLYQEIGVPREIAAALSNMGRMAGIMGVYDEAERYFRRALEIQRKLDDRRGVAVCLHNLSSVAYLGQDFVLARKLRQEALAICREVGYRWGVASSLKGLGDVAFRLGDYGEARRYLQEGLTLWKEFGEQRGEANCLNSLATIALEQGASVEAWDYFGEGLQIAIEIEAFPVALGILGGMAELLAQEGAGQCAWALATFVSNHPAGEEQTREQAQRLRDTLAAQLSPQARAAAEAQVEDLPVKDVVAQVLGTNLGARGAQSIPGGGG